jgi:DNA-binding winged helix-turn-helix (wHTH) protein
MFELDSDTGELRKDGRSRPRIRDQALQILIMLLEKSDEVVSRDELRERLWPADTFVNFDHGLNTAINQVRTALGDSAANPKFIQTLPRRGYRFIGPVQIVGSDGKAVDGAARQAVVASESGAVAGISTSEEEERSALLSEAKDLPTVRRISEDTFFADSADVFDLLYYFPGATAIC